MRGWLAVLALLPASAPVSVWAQGITSTTLPPLPGVSTATAPVRKPLPRVTAPTELGVPVVRSPGPAARKPHAKALAKPAVAPKPPTHVTKPPVAAPVAVAPPAEPPAHPPPPKPDPNKGTTTGLPLPRWAALRSDEVNLRVGPGMDRPVDWQYHRRDLPMRIEREYEIWRLVEDQDGTKGWVNQAVLTGRRGFVVTGAERVLRASAADTADPVAKLEPGVVGLIRGCAAGSAWCEVKAGDYRGWLKRTDIYGVDPDEAVNP